MAVWEFSKGQKEINALKAWMNLENLIAVTKSDIALGITKEKPFLNYDTDTDVTEKTYYRAFAPRLSQSAVVTFDSSLPYHILHELGHLFGADHSDEPDSIMNRHSIETEKFDGRSKHIIRSERNRSFPYQWPPFRWFLKCSDFSNLIRTTRLGRVLKDSREVG